MSKIVKAGWYQSLSDGQSHYCELKEGAQLYRAKCGALFTSERLDFVVEGHRCYWCEKILAADERKRAENEQRKVERKNTRRMVGKERDDDAPSMVHKSRSDARRQRVSHISEERDASAETGIEPLPGVSSHPGDIRESDK